MKKLYWIVPMVIAMAVAFSACSKQGEVNTAPLEKSFQSADSTAQSGVKQAVEAIKRQDYSGAVSELQKLSANVKLTPEQEAAIKDTVQQLQKVIADAAGKVADGATKAANDLKSALPK